MRALLALLTALTLGTALAHTEVTGLFPAHGAHVSAPKAVTLTFGEPVNLRFSVFKVVPLPAGADPAKEAAAVLARRDDAALRVDTAPRLSGMATRVTLPLRAGLKPGAYLTVWRLLSADGHLVSGHAVFYVR
ncbi:copper resistance CopC family protein [Deinococcus sp. YIM 77859]|uniref:copper resistance CopC family protein n=1 Tax=Deinococcus sp. YIM 77859 TaxID=1540221 RepID=UPI000550F651|nr:copper resistance protein CopC [Deinococcus sp. YIM 77859]